MGEHCQNVQGTIASYGHRANEDDPLDLQTVKEELKKIGELYYEINLYQKVRKEQVKRQKQSEQLKKAQAEHQQWIERNK